MKRRILLVDDEVAVLLTMKAILEISGFEVDTAASGREGKSKLHTREYNMVITDMRMENDAAGVEVIEAARSAPYHPAVALLTAFPIADEDWQEMGADKMLVKPMHVRDLLVQIERLLVTHESKPGSEKSAAAKRPAKAPAKKAVAARKSGKKASVKQTTKVATLKKGAKKAAKKPVAKSPAKKTLAKRT